MGVRIEGLNDVLSGLDNLEEAVKAQLISNMGKACALVERSAKQKAPKDTGALRRSITSKVETANNEVVGIVFTPLEYAPYVEFGTGLFAANGDGRQTPWKYKDDKGKWHKTSGQHPQPFLFPALHDNRTQITKLLEKGIK